MGYVVYARPLAKRVEERDTRIRGKESASDNLGETQNCKIREERRRYERRENIKEILRKLCQKRGDIR